MRGLAALAVCIAFPCVAQDSLSLSGTVIAIQSSTRPGALADVTMHNVDRNGSMDEVDFTLTFDGLTVAGRFDWDANEFGDDSIAITPPDGVICVPTDCVLTVDEGSSGVLTLYSLESVGM